MNNKANNIYISQLNDIYGSLLTDKQQCMLNLYYNCDTSLQEIAEEYKITRQAVLDNINRSVDALNNYETKLGVYSKRNCAQNIVAELKTIVQDNDGVMQKITILDSILEDF